MKWQPIETLPEEGYFLIYEDEAVRLRMRYGGKWHDTAYPAIECAPWGDIAVGQDAQRILGEGKKLVLRDGCCENPTHWMHLPAPPEET